MLAFIVDIIGISITYFIIRFSQTILDLFHGRGLKKQLQGFSEVFPRLRDGVPLAGDIEFRT